jgi:hypothetical protein
VNWFRRKQVRLCQSGCGKDIVQTATGMTCEQHATVRAFVDCKARLSVIVRGTFRHPAGAATFRVEALDNILDRTVQ